jgi:hypothetical protein|tara:strand:- start:1903 stop:2274 length:372 start_codon:yes stop_codon:yes gene_type:complete
MQTKHQKLLDEYPFLTVVEYAGKEYLGVVQNIDSHVASIYVYARLRDDKERLKFLELGEEWWWETNRKLPINIALINRWSFAHCVQSFNVKQMEVVAGPEVRLSNSITKRIKRRSINLVKKSQ